MDLTQPQALQSILISGAGILIGFLAKWVFDKVKEDSVKVDEAIDLLRNEMHQNTLALTELKVELKHITSALKVIPEIEKDLNALGRIVREKLNN